jgi:VWFA-related protein
MPRRSHALPLPVMLAGLLVWLATLHVSTQSPQPTFRANVDLTTLDVIPRTADGRFVPDLDLADFDLVEDGVRQQIVTMVLVHGGRVFNKVQPVAAQQSPPEGLILPAARSVDPTAGRIFVVLIDDLHFTATDTPLVRALLKKVGATLFHSGDMIAVFSTGPSSIAIPLTYDHALFTGAIGKVAGRGMSYRDIMDSRDGTQGPQGLRYNAHVAFRTAYDLLGALDRVRDRRKTVILISNGYDFDPFPQGRSGKDQVFGGRYATPWVDPERGDTFLTLGQLHNRFADADLSSELAAVTGVANRVNASIYALDPRGTAGVTSLGDQIDTTEMRTHISKTQGSLRLLAEATGGQAIVNDNDYTDALKRIDAETSDYYILGYTAPAADANRRTRRIDIKVQRPGVQVQSRGWYRTRAPQQTPRPQ